MLSIIVVNCNAGSLLRECLRSVEQYRKDLDYELTVIDNSSTDGSWRIVSEFPEMRLIRNKENRGFPAANNQVLKNTKSDYVLLLNPDTKVTEGAIKRMIGFLDENPEVGILGPKVLYFSGRLQYSSFAFPTLFTVFSGTVFLDRLFPKSRIFNRRNMGYWDHSAVREVDAVSGCCMLIRREVLDDVGLLDDNLFFIEDVDFCQRAKDKDWLVVYFPKSMIYHYGGGSPGSTKRFVPVYYGRTSRIVYFRKHHGRWQALAIALLSLLEMAARILLIGSVYLIRQDEINRSRLTAYFKVLEFIFAKVPPLLQRGQKKGEICRR